MFKLLPDITGIVFFYRDSWRGYEEVITVDVVFYIGGNVMQIVYQDLRAYIHYLRH